MAVLPRPGEQATGALCSQRDAKGEKRENGAWPYLDDQAGTEPSRSSPDVGGLP
ncbi:hypothetical protein [Streptosporangium sp. NPDC020145]|uniref:hypothetical protein n=1 Tax=unclassified Streptosporangium TaxID=2632669 RepID=UPI003427D33C